MPLESPELAGELLVDRKFFELALLMTKKVDAPSEMNCLAWGLPAQIPDLFNTALST